MHNKKLTRDQAREDGAKKVGKIQDMLEKIEEKREKYYAQEDILYN